MKPLPIHQFFPALEKVAHLLATLREEPAAWAAFNTWPSIYWAAVHYDSATAPGGVAQQRRLAAYSAACLLEEVEFEVKYALRLKAVVLLSTAELMQVVRACRQAGVVPQAADAASSAKRSPHRSPTRRLEVPLVVMRGATYRPRSIVLEYPGFCISCGDPIAAGEVAQISRSVGVAHASCTWPLFDAPRFPITLPAKAT